MVSQHPAKVYYPDSDGQPMADNTKQFRWIVTIKENLDLLFAADPNVFVAGDLLWYPIEGDNTTRTAPDTMVIFGRPKGDRGSYQQWKEDNIPPQVVFEILSPGNRMGEMERKRQFYERYGVAEYYIYDPDRLDLSGWMRSDDKLVPIFQGKGSANEAIEDWVSARLGIRFVIHPGEELVIYRPDGEKFIGFGELDELRRSQQQRADDAEREVFSANLRANSAERAAIDANLRADSAEREAARLAAKLRELGIDP
jgi:Uma2 family endonuclease